MTDADAIAEFFSFLPVESLEIAVMLRGAQLQP
jgi:hypothetical protein